MTYNNPISGRKISTAIFPIIALIFLSACIFLQSASAKPNRQNLLCPMCHGLIEISKNVFTDAPEQADELNKFVENARNTTKEFFGLNMSNPKIILCTRDSCTKIFVKKMGRGASFRADFLLMSPKGVNETIITHELVHTEIYKRLSLTKKPTITDTRIPTWFNEGLATYLSKDNRFASEVSNADFRFAYGLKNMKTWRKHVTMKKYKRGYQSARALVADLDRKMGRANLKRIVDLVAFGGSTFDKIVEPYLDIQ